MFLIARNFHFFVVIFKITALYIPLSMAFATMKKLLNNVFITFLEVSEYAKHNDAILLVIISTAQAPDLAL